MNLKKTVGILLSLIFLFITQNLLADSELQALIDSKVTIQQVINTAKKANLSNISSIEFDNGYWQIKTLKNQTEIKYILNPITLKLTKLSHEHEDDKQPPNAMTVLENSIQTVAKKHPEYKIKSISYESFSWNINAYDKTEMEHELLVNGEGSKILFSKIDD
ncbi:MAG: hypothetical protein GY756_26650 [bacterium]|nr:hypothetical protein [bacterium]